MAIYHLSVKPVSRSEGRSATAAIAYRSAEKVLDYMTGETFDYTRKQGVEHTEIVLPTEVAKLDINWARDRQSLWNAAEGAEKRKDARVAREYEVALPHELSASQRVELVRAFSQELANRYGVAVDFAIHAPHRSGDERNHHAHVLSTTRVIEREGLGAKAAIEWSDTDRAKKGLGPAKEDVKEIRAQWAALTNERLKELKLEIRVDHRSLEAQGLERTPTVHLGPAVMGLERRGIETEVGKRIAWEREQALQLRLERAAELGQIEREGKEVEKSILDLSGDLQRAKRERELALGHSSEKSGRDRFQGLQLGTRRGAEKEVFAGVPLASTGRSVEIVRPGAMDPVALELERYGRAWADAARMPEQGLPVLEHQKLALQEAARRLERVQPGAVKDLETALVFEPGRGKELVQLQGPEQVKALQAVLKQERSMRADPRLRAERVVKTWSALETEYTSLKGSEHAKSRSLVEERMKTLVVDLKQDEALSATLTREIELPKRSRTLQITERLERVVKAKTLEQALELGGRDKGLHLSL